MLQILIRQVVEAVFLLLLVVRSIALHVIYDYFLKTFSFRVNFFIRDVAFSFPVFETR